MEDLVGDMGIESCRLRRGVPEDELNRPKVSAILQEVRRKGVSQDVCRNLFVNASCLASQGAVMLYGSDSNRFIRVTSREQPVLEPSEWPIFS